MVRRESGVHFSFWRSSYTDGVPSFSKTKTGIKGEAALSSCVLGLRACEVPRSNCWTQESGTQA